MARSVLLTRRDWVAHPATVFSGGAWVTPFETLTDPRPQVVLQAVSPEPDATTFTLDFGVIRNIGIIQFQNLRISPLSTMRIRAGTDPAFASNVFDTGVVTGWPADKAPFSISTWGELTLNGVYETEEYLAFGMPRFFIPTTPFLARYLKVDIVDPTADVPAQIGCMGAYEVWQPQFAEWGWTEAIIDESEVQTAPYGSRFIVPRGKRRRINIGLSFKDPQLKSVVIGWAAIMGKSTPMVISVNPDDTQNVEKRSVYGTMVEDPSIVNPYFAFHQMAITVEQLI